MIEHTPQYKAKRDKLKRFLKMKQLLPEKVNLWQKMMGWQNGKEDVPLTMEQAELIRSRLDEVKVAIDEFKRELE